ncbi:MAG: RNA polymerase sigma factor [Phycisphaerales bacterium]
MLEDKAPQAGSLVDAAIAGDRGALRALWQQHRRWVAAVLIAHKPNSADVDDLLQEVAITLLAKIHTLSEPGSFVPWLRMIALNTARLAGRRFAASPRTVSLEAAAGGSSDGAAAAGGAKASEPGRVESGPGRSRTSPPDQHASAGEESRRLMALAAELPEDYREPLLLRCVQELSYRQISAILSLPETTIETRIARARRMLRERAGDGAKPSLFPSHPHLSGGARVGVFRHPKGPDA